MWSSHLPPYVPHTAGTVRLLSAELNHKKKKREGADRKYPCGVAMADDVIKVMQDSHVASALTLLLRIRVNLSSGLNAYPLS